MNGLQSSAYNQAHAGDEWPGGEGYPGPLVWLEDQVKFLFDINMNTIAGWLTHIQSGGEDKWYNAEALDDYNDPQCDCPDGVPDGHFSQMDFACNAELARQVNLSIPEYNLISPEAYPRDYFPFVLYLYPITPYIGNNITEHMLPDIWNKYFEERLYLMCFLVLSDGTEPDPLNECDGRWKYQEVLNPVVADIIDVETLLVPMYYICHRPEGMREWKSLISYALSDDVQWAYSIYEGSDNSMEYRPWIRRILCQECESGQPAPAGRTAFAQAMKDFYNNSAQEWNETEGYYIEDDRDFRISRFMDLDPPQYGYEEFPSLERMPNPDCIECMMASYPGGIKDDNNDQIGQWLREYDTDLGRVLTKADAAEFTRVMAAQYYPLVIDAIRFFDGCHLISSSNFNWFRKGSGPAFSGMEQFYQVFEEMSKATGNVFTDTKDCISYINTQFYPNVPEHVEGSEMGTSYTTYFCHLKNTYKYIRDEGLRELPFMVASYTSHADWEKGWDYAWPEPALCPVNETPTGNEHWYDCAPFPHGNKENCMANGGCSECYNPGNYTYTESGLLDRCVPPSGTEFGYGRGDDYNLVTSASLHPVTCGGKNVNFILGYSWHSFYDSGFGDDEAEETAACNNWGIVNPKCFVSGESSGSDEQYLELHDFIRDMNGYIQEELGDGSTWSNKPGPDPPPETTDPFVCED